MALVLITPPGAEPLDLDTVKTDLRNPNDQLDSLVETHISGARKRAEDYTGRAFINREYRLYLDSFPAADKPIELPMPPLTGVTEIRYVDTYGNTQTIESSGVRVDPASEPGRITPLYGESWPDARVITNAIEIDFTAGYGAVGEDNTPAEAKQAMFLLTEAAFERDERTMKIYEDAAMRLLDPLRVNPI